MVEQLNIITTNNTIHIVLDHIIKLYQIYIQENRSQTIHHGTCCDEGCARRRQAMTNIHCLMEVTARLRVVRVAGHGDRCVELRSHGGRLDFLVAPNIRMPRKNLLSLKVLKFTENWSVQVFFTSPPASFRLPRISMAPASRLW